MAVQHFSWASNVASASTSVVLPSTILPSGAYLVVAAAQPGSSTISDSQGGSWTLILTHGTLPNHRIWFRTTPGNGTAFSVTVSSGTNGKYVAFGSYFTGASGSYSNFSNISTGTTSWPTSALAGNASKAGDLRFVFLGATMASGNSIGALTPGSGFTLGNYSDGTTTSGRYFVGMEYKIATGSGYENTTFSSSGTLSETKIQSFVIYASQDFEGWGLPI